ncbi:HAD family hydrolase [Ascidiaceihabitans sp.]|uniref:HAD family hydrolase n=1 Tax=Ascidiaceihabitans sp. TaxID=1872644 RepID=UPI00329A482F
MSTPFDLVVWDFDGVLNANIVDGRFVWVDQIEADLGVNRERFQNFVFRSGLIQDVVAGRRDLLEVVADWITRERLKIDADAFLDYWFEHDALPDPQAIDWLKDYGGRSVIGTNNEARRAAYIENQMGFGAHVEAVFASGRMKVAKPDQAFFEQIETWSGTSGDKILLVDDTLKNIEAAQAKGWQGLYFTPETRNHLPALLGLEV